MSYNNSGRKNQSEENKEKIIKAAFALINEKGFDDVSVNEITNLAGVSKGAFYIHFKSKKDLIEQQISLFNELILDNTKSKYERLEYFLLESIKYIKESGLKMAQEWFSHSVKGSFFGKSKLSYDRKTINEIVNNKNITDEIVGVYYGALNLWCFTNGEVNPEEIVSNYLKELKDRL